MTATTTTVVAAIAVLAAGTYAMRLSGIALRLRAAPSARAQRRMTLAVTVLFCALIATATVLDGAEPAGVARPAGVAVGGLLAWRRASFVVVVLAAAVVAAGLRQLGVA